MKLLFIENWVAGETLRAIGWTLFHSLWIGLLAAVASGIIIISTRRSTARLRYNLLIGIMFLFLLGCGFAFFTQIKSTRLAVIETQESNINTAVSDFSSGEQAYIKQKNFIDEFTQYFDANADILVFIWLIFFAVHFIKLLTGLGGIQRLRNYRISVPGDEWIAKLQVLSKKLGIHQSVTLLQSELIKVPIAIGFFKPAILVPLSLLSNLPPVQVEAILLHELAHIRRRDYLVNVLQRFAEAIFFFNPSFIWLCSLIRQEREACCDDIVIATTGQKKNYLEALVSFQEYSVTSTGYAMAIKSKQHYLLNRVKRLLTRENKKLNAMEKLLLLFGLIVLTAFTIIPQKDETKKKQTANAVTVNHAVEPGTQTVELIKPPVKTPIDTVPPKDKRSENDFKLISSNVNTDGNTKTETITAVDPTGKKYTITKLNDKVTSLQIDDTIIPENEIGKYASVITEIDKAREKNRARKMKEMEARKISYEKKQIEHENKLKEKSKLAEDKLKNKTVASDNKSEQAIRKKIDTKRKELDADRKILEQKRKEMSDVKNEITIKKKELEKKDGKDREIIQKQIKDKAKTVENKLKEIENRKKIIGGKKEEIGKEKANLERIKEKDNEKKIREKEKVNKMKDKGDGDGKGKGEGGEKEPAEQPNSKNIFKENSIALKQEANHGVDVGISSKSSYNYKNQTNVKVSSEPQLEMKENKSWDLDPTAPGWKPAPASKSAPGLPPAPSKKLFKKTQSGLFKKSENRNTPGRTSTKRVEL